MKYEPAKFEITKEISDLIIEINLSLKKLHLKKNFSKLCNLKRSNLIQSVQSTCAIENNHLSLEQVKYLFENNVIDAPEKEILEVQNAINTYNQIRKYKPFDLNSLLRAHANLTTGLISRPGKFRQNNEGVYSGDNCIFMAPPKDLVPDLMCGLIDWTNKNNNLDFLLLSCIFHYEFIFIHPFQDGNGRTARLWQKIILGNHDAIFYDLPFEKYIKQSQEQYYKVIYKSNCTGDMTNFIEYLLKIISVTLAEFLKCTTGHN